MEALAKAIYQMGHCIAPDIIKVDEFLNHRIDTALMLQMGSAIADRFAPDMPDLILSIEASGIALGLATAQALGNIPLVFAKKSYASNQRPGMAQATIHSFTKNASVIIRADLNYIPRHSRVLIVDDFLARGEAVRGLMSLALQAGGNVIGVAVAIEKGFEDGGKQLREAGIPLLSLAVIESIHDGRIVLRGC